MACGSRPPSSQPEFFASIMETVTLYRPVGPEELELIEASGWRAFPPRLLREQPVAAICSTR
jgi:hypothetical protein